MKSIFITLSCLLFTQFAFSQSALRFEGESPEAAEIRSNGSSPNDKRFGRRDKRLPYDKLNFEQLVDFESLDELKMYFNELRDLKFLRDPENKTRLRRESWMYPDDGCWVRAHLMRYNMEKIFQLSVNKVFVYGRLTVQTEFHPRKKVTWWYHVAPIVKVKDEPYVLDPSIDYSSPLTLKEWASLQAKSTKRLKFKICDGNTYDPNDHCEKPKEKDIEFVKKQQSKFLNKERARLDILDLNTDTYLGPKPPWMSEEI